MKIELDARCPYCHAVTRYIPDCQDYPRPEIVLCDPEGGGCDDYFAVTWRAPKVHSRSFALGGGTDATAEPPGAGETFPPIDRPPDAGAEVTNLWVQAHNGQWIFLRRAKIDGGVAWPSQP